MTHARRNLLTKGVVITTLQLEWSPSDPRGQDWSAEWRGLLIWPRDGEITLTVTAEDPVTLQLGDRQPVTSTDVPGARRIIWRARGGEAVPLRLTYDHPRRSGGGRLEVQWSSEAGDFVPVSADALHHSDRDAAWSDDLLFTNQF